jgi:hypothetical protein
VNAIYVIDEEYSAFAPAWSDLRKLLETTGSIDETVIEPLRITFSGNSGERWVTHLSQKPDGIGWHYAYSPTEKYLLPFRTQAQELIRKQIRFRVLSQPFGKAQMPEIRYDAPDPPFVAIPFEDHIKNVGRFFGRYIGAFQKAYGWSASRSRQNVVSLHEHVQKTAPQEEPLYPASGGALSFLRSTSKEHLWVPKYGTVGRHELLQELQIHQNPADPAWMAKLLSELESVEKKEPAKLYFQFFTPFSAQPSISMVADALHEMTYEFTSIPFWKGEELFLELESDGLLNSLRDTFSLFEQRRAMLGMSCNLTYILRRAANQMYEIRVNATWDEENIDPEQAVVSVEKMSGLPWALIA